MSKQQLAAEAIPAPRVSLGEPVLNPMPFWQAEPCPPWCDAAASPIGHSNRDAYSERQHYHTAADIPLTMCEGDRVGAEADSMPPEMTLSMFQHYRAAAAEVILGVPVAIGSHDYAIRDVYMTVAEARALRDGLTALLDLVDNDLPRREAGAR